MLRTRKDMEALESRSLLAELRGRRGSIATQTALVIPAMLGFTAVAVDAAYLYVERTHLQSVVDGAALAAASGFRVSTGPDEVYDRAEFVFDENTMITGSAYTWADSAVELGEWVDYDDPAYDGTTLAEGFALFNSTGPDGTISTTDTNTDGVPDEWVEFITLSPRPAVRVTAPPQSAGLFFGGLFVASGVSNVGASAVVSFRPNDAAPPANCGILSDSLTKNQGMEIDGYKSASCGGSGFDPTDANADKWSDTADKGTGICSNGDLEQAGSASTYGGGTYGPDGSFMSNNDFLSTSQLAQKVTLPPVEKCDSLHAAYAASNTFWSDPVNWYDCIDANADGKVPDTGVGAPTAGTASSYVTVALDKTDGSGQYDVKVTQKDTFFVFSDDCGAPQKICVHDLEQQSSAGYGAEASSYASGPVEVIASGDIVLKGQGIVNLEDSEITSGVVTSNGEQAGDLEIHLWNSSSTLDIAGQGALSAIVFTMGQIDYTGGTDFYGDIFAYGEVDLNGSGRLHLDRCFEISSGEDSACPDWWPGGTCPETLTRSLHMQLVQ